MQKSSLCGTKSLYNSVLHIIAPPLSKNYKDSTGQRSKKYELNLLYLYQISHFSSMKIHAKMYPTTNSTTELGPWAQGPKTDF
jgi:hypothetical protein